MRTGKEIGIAKGFAECYNIMPECNRKKTKGGERMSQKKTREVPWNWFLFLHISLLINSLPGVASKLAGRYGVLSSGFLFFCALSIFLLGVFAVVWQQVLRHMSLTFALTNKPITVIYSLIWGALIFGEKIRPGMVIGSLVIIAGIMIGVSGDE